MPKRQTRKKHTELPTFIKLDVESAKKKKQGTPLILVPYRDNAAKERSAQLKLFVEHFSKGSWKDIPVLIIEQSEDERAFNRAALLNVGARLAKKYSHIILHDVDLLPEESLVPYYTMIPDHPVHIGTVWRTKYTSERFLGGILSISLKDFQRVNGYPNQFWGWGGEDDVLRNRLIRAKIPIYRPNVHGGITELPHAQAVAMRNKREKVLADRGKDGVHQTRWKTLHKESLASHIDKYTVELNS
jgi:hypothetical protein